jgi:hypothetical protein
VKSHNYIFIFVPISNFHPRPNLGVDFVFPWLQKEEEPHPNSPRRCRYPPSFILHS